MDGTFMIRERLLTDGERDDILNGLGTRISQLRERDYCAQGEILITVKETYLKHGEWIDWLRENVSFTYRHAERLIKTAKWMRGKNSITKSLPFTKAYILTRLTSSEYEDFLHEVSMEKIKSMRKVDLEILVRKYVESHK